MKTKDKLIKIVFRIFLLMFLISCKEEVLELSSIHIEKMRAKTTQVTKLNSFYETYEIFLAIVPNEVYINTILSRVDDSIKTSIVVLSKPEQIIHFQDLRIKNGLSINSIKSEDYKSISQIDKNDYGKVSIFNVSRRQLRDFVNNSREDYIYIDFLGFQYKIDVEKISNYLKTLNDVLTGEWDKPLDLDLQLQEKPIGIPKEIEEEVIFDEIEN